MVPLSPIQDHKTRFTVDMLLLKESGRLTQRRQYSCPDWYEQFTAKGRVSFFLGTTPDLERYTIGTNWTVEDVLVNTAFHDSKKRARLPSEGFLVDLFHFKVEADEDLQHVQIDVLIRAKKRQLGLVRERLSLAECQALTNSGAFFANVVERLQEELVWTASCFGGDMQGDLTVEKAIFLRSGFIAASITEGAIPHCSIMIVREKDGRVLSRIEMPLGIKMLSPDFVNWVMPNAFVLNTKDSETMIFIEEIEQSADKTVFREPWKVEDCHVSAHHFKGNISSISDHDENAIFTNNFAWRKRGVLVPRSPCDEYLGMATWDSHEYVYLRMQNPSKSTLDLTVVEVKRGIELARFTCSIDGPEIFAWDHEMITAVAASEETVAVLCRKDKADRLERDVVIRKKSRKRKNAEEDCSDYSNINAELAWREDFSMARSPGSSNLYFWSRQDCAEGEGKKGEDDVVKLNVYSMLPP